MKTIRCNSWEDFCNKRRANCLSSPKQEWVYRGQANIKGWSLKTTLARNYENISPKNHREVTDNYKKFINEVFQLDWETKEYDKPYNQIAQHFGMPTNLLDWTISFITAFQFACLQTQKCIVQSINIYALGIKKSLVDRPQEKKGVLSIYDPMNWLGWNSIEYPQKKIVEINPRIQIQQGLFTYHHNISFDLQKNNSGLTLIKYQIKINDQKIDFPLLQNVLYPDTSVKNLESVFKIIFKQTLNSVKNTQKTTK